ncbi:MAG: CFAP97 domain-containing protein [Candidatus Pacebacteria bacterium]|nr:CFAP97 domain-containing protein [Candidatus Paceibacterota bacterium]
MQLFNEDCTRILRENQILLKKMIDIDRRPSQHSTRNPDYPVCTAMSLNVVLHRKRSRRIREENSVLPPPAYGDR